MSQLNAALDRARHLAPLVLRIVLGIVFAVHGYDKLFGGMGLGGVEMFFSSNGVPAAGVAAPFVAIVELVGGIALIVGALTRVTALLLAVIMVGAMLFVKFEMGLLGGYELDASIFAGLVALALIGPGAMSVDARTSAEPATTA